MECWACFVSDKAAVLGVRWVVLGVQGRGKSQKPECVCPLSLYVDQLSLGLSVSLSSGILCWCWCKDFCPKVQEGHFLPALPFLGQGSFLLSSPGGPGLCQALLHLHPS